MKSKLVGAAIYLGTVVSAGDEFTYGLANAVGAGYSFASLTAWQKCLIASGCVGALLFLLAFTLMFLRPRAAYSTGLAAACLMWPAFAPHAYYVAAEAFQRFHLLWIRLHGVNELISVTLLFVATLFSAFHCVRGARRGVAQPASEHFAG
jgi:hypothetical protein